MHVNRSSFLARSTSRPLPEIVMYTQSLSNDCGPFSSFVDNLAELAFSICAMFVPPLPMTKPIISAGIGKPWRRIAGRSRTNSCSCCSSCTNEAIFLKIFLFFVAHVLRKKKALKKVANKHSSRDHGTNCYFSQQRQTNYL